MPRLPPAKYAGLRPALGTERLSAVLFEHRAAEERIAADLLILHQGVAPELDLAAAARCKLAWNERQLAFTHPSNR